MSGTNLFAPAGASVEIALTDNSGNAILVKCTTGNIPNSVAGYAIGCILINTTTGVIYTNTGTAALCSFVAADSDIIATVSDNTPVTLGSTTATPATYGKLVYSTTTALFQYTAGTSAVPQVLSATAGSLVKARENVINVIGETNTDDLLIDYKKINILGAGDSGMTPVTDRAILNVGLTGGSNNSAISEGYVRQDTLTKGGTGTVERLGLYSGVLDLGTNNFTSNSSINGQTLVIQGTATVATGKVRGYSVDIKTGRVVESAYTANCQTTTTNGFEVTGSPVHEFMMSSNIPIMTGTAVTLVAVEAMPGASAAPIGTLFIGTGVVGTTKPNMYIKVTSTAWERIVTQNSN